MSCFLSVAWGLGLLVSVSLMQRLSLSENNAYSLCVNHLCGVWRESERRESWRDIFDGVTSRSCINE